MYYFFLVYLSFAFSIYSKYNKLVFLVLVGSVLILFSGLRYESGIDYFNYKILYEYNYIASSEILFWLLVDFHKNIFNSYELFIFIISSITIFVKLYLINKFNPKYLWLSMLIFISVSYISIDMGLIRSSLSIMFFMMSVYSLYNYKNKTSYFYFFLGFLFHHSIFFMIYIYFINKNSNITRLYLLTMVVASLIAFSNSIETFIYELVNYEFIKSNFTYFSWKVNHYLISEDYTGSGFNFYTMRILFLAIIFYAFHRRLTDGFFIKIYIVGACIALILGFNIQLYTRLGVYLTLFEILLMSQVLNIFKGWSKVIVGFGLVIIYLVLFFRTSYIFEIYKVTFL